MSSFFEIGIILILLIGNGVFALAEIAVVSSRRARLRMQAEEGLRGAESALALSENPERFLSTVQVGITLVGILAGAFGGAALSEDLATVFVRLGFTEEWALRIAFVFVVGVITYFSLIIGELVPKQIALRNPEAAARFVAPAMTMLSRAASPLVHLLSMSTGAFFWILRSEPATESLVTEDEVNVLIEQGAKAGVFHEAEQRIVARVLRLGDRPVKQLMTPRTDVMWLSIESTFEENFRTITESGYSHYPICGKNADQVLGVVRLKDAWKAVLPNPDATPAKNVDFVSIAFQPLSIPETIPAVDVLELFRKEKQHFALVLDEYGGLAGVVTDHDILEALVGDLSSDGDGTEEGITHRADGSFLVSGWVGIPELREALDDRDIGEESEGRYHTAAGLALEAFKRIPNTGETIVHDGWEIEVVDKDGNRIDKLIMRSVEPTSGEYPSE